MTPSAAVEEVRVRHEDIALGIDTPDLLDVEPEHVLAMFRQAHADRATLLRAYEAEERKASRMELARVDLVARVAALEEGLRRCRMLFSSHDAVREPHGGTLCGMEHPRTIDLIDRLLAPPAPKGGQT